MAGALALTGLMILTACAASRDAEESRALSDAKALPVLLDVLGSPVLIVRDKRASYPGYPHQSAMLFTGFYRTTRHSASDGGGGGLYARGNYALGGGAGSYLAGRQSRRQLRQGPEPVDEELEISRADAEAAPDAPADREDDGAGGETTTTTTTTTTPRQGDERRPEQEESTTQARQNTETNVPADEFLNKNEPAEPRKQPARKVGAKNQSKKNKKIPVQIEEEEDDEYIDEDNEAPIPPFVPPRPFAGAGRNKQYPGLNNFFPIVFSFPGLSASRGGFAPGKSDGSPPLIAAIANSYSTGKGGVASSVATAYGGAPTKKQRRIPATE